MPNGAPAASKTSNPSTKDKGEWAAPTTNNLSLGKAPPGRDPRSRARSRDYLKQCLLELSYLTSPQAMNPLPGRPLLNNANGPPGAQGNNPGGPGGMQGNGGLALPHLPNFNGDGGLNGRQKKGMDMGAKEFTLVNGTLSNDRLDKSSGLFGGMQSLPGSSSISGSLLPPSEGVRSGDAMTQLIANREGGGGSGGHEEEPTQLTAIFRPDDAGAWREKLRQANEDALRQQGGMSNSTGYMSSISALNNSGGISGWDIGLGGEEGVSHEEEEEDGEGLVGDDTGKKWKVRKTLRKYVVVLCIFPRY
jgi:striatin 1/3/4